MRTSAISSLVRFSSLHSVHHGLSTRHGGVSPVPFDTLNTGYGVTDVEANVTANRAIVAQTLGVPAERILAGTITHGKEVSVFSHSHPDAWPVHRVPPRPDSCSTVSVFPSDGVVSDVPGLYFLLTFADCVPLLFSSPGRQVMGMAHAGWRGTALGIGPQVVRSLDQAFGIRPEEIAVGIGPSIGPCCYHVGSDVVSAFSDRGYAPVMTGAGTLDLWATNRTMLQEAGVPAGQIECLNLCTSCHRDTFFSHRADRGRTGRFALVAGLPG